MNINELYNKFLNKPKNDIREHLSTLKSLGRGLVITEFGVRWGASTTAWLLSVPKKLTCYDIKILSGFETTVNIFTKWANQNNIDFKILERDVLKIDIDETDILFIDTFHVYRQLKEELEIHHSKVRKYIVLHDTETFGKKGEDGSVPGLLQAVDEFISVNQEWKIKKIYKNNNGLLIMEKNG